MQDSVYETFAKKFADKVSAMKVGNGLEDGVVQGPLIDMKAVEKVEEHISDALSKGAHVLTGPIHIEEARPGDMLEVRVLDIEFRVAYGQNYTAPGRGVLV